jgi:hypothetical protein
VNQQHADTARVSESELTMATTFKLNGKAASVDADASTPLLWVLRDDIGLTGTFGCGAACVVPAPCNMNVTAIRWCITPLSAVVGADAHDRGPRHRPSGPHVIDACGSKTWRSVARQR